MAIIGNVPYFQTNPNIEKHIPSEKLFQWAIFNSYVKTYRGWVPQDSVQLVYKWLNSMVYGRYNYSYCGL